MQNRYIPAITMLSAGAIVSIFCIVNKIDTLYSLKLLLGMLIAFYIVGLVVKRVFGKIQEDAELRAAKKKQEEEQEAEAMESDEEQQEEDDEEKDENENSQGMDE